MTLRLLSATFLLSVLAGGAQAAPFCDLSGVTPVAGMHADGNGGMVTLGWPGENGASLRASFTIKDGQPLIRELAVQEKGAPWIVLAHDVTPDFQVTTGKRRLSSEQLAYLKKNHMDSPENITARQWDTFWDAPLSIPGAGTQDGFLPRKPEDVRHDKVSYHSTRCSVHSEGYRLSVGFDGLTLGLFTGKLQFTVYKGSNLLRQAVIASTDAKDVAFIYKGGLKGLPITAGTKLEWRDTARQWQSYQFGGGVNDGPVNLCARNRLEILDVGKGALAVLTPPHKFFFARENEVNLGYVYYRKDNDGSFSLGIMQPERAEGYKAWGVSDAEWARRSDTQREEEENLALYNAPPGSVQHMGVYYYLSGRNAAATDNSVLAYTHNDVFKPVPGFKVLSGHFHFDFNEMIRDSGNPDMRPEWVSVLKGLGVNILYLGDFHDDSDPHDGGTKRLNEQKVYFDGTRRVSDKDFLVIPAEEVNSYFGGHWYMLPPKPFYFTHANERAAGQQFVQDEPGYGPVYHLGSAADAFEMVKREGAIMWTAHPRTKSSEGYPEAYKDKDFFLSDRFIGASWESLPVDLSQSRLCELRCFGTGDDESNWAPKPKFLIAEGDTYAKSPDDETYPQLAVNYLKIDKVPQYDQGWNSVVEAMRAGEFYGTTGEVLFHNWGVQGSGPRRIYTAEVEYTYPLDFAELVWSDGKTVDRKLIDLKATMPFGTRKFAIPFDATGKRWVRFTVWDAAGDGAFVQPIALN